MVLCEAKWECLQRIDWAFAKEWLNEEFVSYGAELGSIVVDIVRIDDELSKSIVSPVIIDIIKPARA